LGGAVGKADKPGAIETETGNIRLVIAVEIAGE
jgi:hypothetical protein